MTVRLVQEQPCPTCDAFVNPFAGIAGIPVCPTCGGTSVLVSPISCAGCANFQPNAFEGGGAFCQYLYDGVDADWGCLSWTAKEGTDGNG